MINFEKAKEILNAENVVLGTIKKSGTVVWTRLDADNNPFSLIKVFGTDDQPIVWLSEKNITLLNAPTVVLDGDDDYYFINPVDNKVEEIKFISNTLQALACAKLHKIGEVKAVLGLIKKNPGEKIPAWFFPKEQRDETFFIPVFKSDTKKLKKRNGKTIPPSELEVEILHDGRYFWHNGRCHIVKFMNVYGGVVIV